jgi:hypothetical protein
LIGADNFSLPISPANDRNLSTRMGRSILCHAYAKIRPTTCSILDAGNSNAPHSISNDDDNVKLLALGFLVGTAFAPNIRVFAGKSIII